MLVCTRCFKKKAHACRHIYKLINRFPKLTDAHIRWHLAYAHYHGRNGEMSKHFQDLRDKVDLPGIPITDEELEILNATFPVGSGEANEEYFSRGLPGTLLLRGNRKNCHWKAFPYRFQGVDQSCFASDDAKEIPDSSTADNCVADDSASISGLASKPFGASAVIQGSSSYMVPSQMENDSDEECAKRGSDDAYHGYMPTYHTVP